MISSGKSAMIFRHGSKLINSGLYFPYRIILAAVAFPHGSVIYTVFPRIAHKLAIPYMFISFSRFLYADNLPTTVAIFVSAYQVEHSRQVIIVEMRARRENYQRDSVKWFIGIGVGNFKGRRKN